MSSSPEAGPSRSYEEEFTQTQTQTASMPAPRKKARLSQTADIFAQPDIKQRAKIGQSLRDLQAEVDDDRANIKNIGIENFRKVLEKQDAVFQNVQDTESGALDAKVFQNTTDLVYHWTKQQNQNTNSFDTDEFFMQIKGLLGLGRVVGGAHSDDDGSEQEDELDEEDSAPRAKRGGGGRSQTLLGDWEKIGWMAAKMTRRVPGIEFMYGPLSTEHKKRVMKERQKKAALAPEQKPQEIVQAGKGEKVEDTSAFVKRVFIALQEADPDKEGINFFKFAINPESYGQSVENIFFISFLIRDGRVGLDVDNQGEMTIRIRVTPDQGGGGDGSVNQGVMEFDYAAWELAKDTFNITESLIPNREPTELAVPGANSWY